MKPFLRLLVCLPSLYGALATAADGDWYVGAGGGVSRLTPNADGSGFTLEEKGSAAVGVFGGRAFGSRYAAELGVTRLGEAGLSDGEAIEYSVLAAGALGYVFGDPDRVRRGEATGGYLKLGLGAIDNASDVPLEQEDDLSVWAAVGVDVPFGRVWAFRAELASFDGDAQAALASLVWRPRSAARRPVLARAPQTAPAPARAPEAAVDVAASGSDAETAPDAARPVEDDRRDGADAALLASGAGTVEGGASRPDASVAPVSPPPAEPATTPAVPPPPVERASAPAVPPFEGVLDGVDFAPGTATLTAGGERALDALAARLLANPGVTVELRAHALAGADAAAARLLSRERAVATARRLAGQGVPVDRLRARAFGSERPPSVPGAPLERIEIGVVTP